jgi:tetratricopeptide (TPR) repeat protein
VPKIVTAYVPAQLPAAACRISGKAAYYLGEYASAVDHFDSATALDGESLPAWEGLAFTQIAMGEVSKAIETYHKLVSD